MEPSLFVYNVIVIALLWHKLSPLPTTTRSNSTYSMYYVGPQPLLRNQRLKLNMILMSGKRLHQPPPAQLIEILDLNLRKSQQALD